MTYALHPLAALVPEMTPEQFADLREDVRAHGLLEPIVLHEHMVLDGRHRLRACEETGISPRFTAFDGSSPVEFVISKNVKRRHLSSSQLAAIAVEFLPAMEAEARERMAAAGRSAAPGTKGVSPEPPFRESGRATEQAGALVGVSRVSVNRAKRVARDAPEMFEQVKAGTLTVKAADTALRERAAAAPQGRNPIKQHRMPPAATVVPKVLAGLRLHATELDRALREGSVETEEAADWSRDLSDVMRSLRASNNCLKEQS